MIALQMSLWVQYTFSHQHTEVRPLSSDVRMIGIFEEETSCKKYTWRNRLSAEDQF